MKRTRVEKLKGGKRATYNLGNGKELKVLVRDDWSVKITGPEDAVRSALESLRYFFRGRGVKVKGPKND